MLIKQVLRETEECLKIIKEYTKANPIPHSGGVPFGVLEASLKLDKLKEEGSRLGTTIGQINFLHNDVIIRHNNYVYVIEEPKCQR